MNKYSFSNAALFPMETLDALLLIKQAGFDCAELMPQAYSDASEESAERFEKAGIQVASIHFPLVLAGFLYTAHRSMARDGIVYSRSLLKMGARLGAKILVVHAHKPDTPEFEELFRDMVMDNIRRLADECRKAGITMALENSAKTCHTPEMLLAYIDELGCEGIKPMVDIVHVREAGGDPVSFLRRIKPCHLHLSDFVNGESHLPPGEGDQDWKGIRNALEGYEGIYTVEPSRRYYMLGALERMRRDLEFMKSAFD